MRHLSHVTIAVIALTLVLVMPSVVAAGPSLTVRVVNLSKLDDREVLAALEVAADRYDRVGIAVDWTVCGRCRGPLDPGGVWLRIAPETVHSSRELGASALDPVTGAGVIATVFPGAIRTLAGDAAGSFERLFGTVVAHEIGHLLLGSDQHAPRGVMQRGWTVSEARSHRAVEFSTGEGSRMRERLVQRIAGE